MERVVEALAGELSAATLYRILGLRSQVFVVEQSCVYLDPDGRDLEGTTRHLWIEDGVDGDVVACARVLAEDEGCSIGRVVTAVAHRSRGHGGELVQAALARAPRPVRINAQSHLVDWYAQLGFAVDGAEFVEDGIAHTPMVVA
ncbi:MAG: GNAT family N-acetyltransferase [Actinomycetota bacterium]|nr:GNAT family N-acetyltransferase [Actinomycetota bacterium]